MAGLELISDQGLRSDGRRPYELRKVQCRIGVFGQADGSAYVEQGLTKVLAAVYGPHEIRGSKSNALQDKVLLNCQYSMATFSTGQRKARPRGDRKSHEMSMNLKQTFEAAIKTELYPRSQLDIFVEVLQADGGNYCACVNAATLALIDAGIPMRDYVVGCTASLVNDIPLVDVSHLEASLGGPELDVAILPRSEQLVLVEMSQRFHVDHLEKVLDVAVQGAKDIFTILENTVVQHTKWGGQKVGLGR